MLKLIAVVKNGIRTKIGQTEKIITPVSDKEWLKNFEKLLNSGGVIQKK